MHVYLNKYTITYVCKCLNKHVLHLNGETMTSNCAHGINYEKYYISSVCIWLYNIQRAHNVYSKTMKIFAAAVVHTYISDIVKLIEPTVWTKKDLNIQHSTETSCATLILQYSLSV